MCRKCKGVKGITLISLVITIIVLIILASVSINAVLSDNGLLKRAQEAKEEYEKATAKEELNLIIASMRIEKSNKEFTMQTIVDELGIYI